MSARSGTGRKVGETGAGGEKDRAGAERGAKDRAAPAKPGAEQQTPGDRQEGGARNRQRDQRGVSRDIEEQCGRAPARDEILQPGAVRGESGEAQVALSAGGEKRRRHCGDHDERHEPADGPA